MVGQVYTGFPRVLVQFIFTRYNEENFISLSFVELSYMVRRIMLTIHILTVFPDLINVYYRCHSRKSITCKNDLQQVPNQITSHNKKNVLDFENLKCLVWYETTGRQNKI